MEYNPAAPLQQGTTISNSSGLKLTSIGSMGVYQFIANDGNSAGVANSSATPGNSFNLTPYTDNIFQQWQITKVSDTAFSVRNLGSSLYLQSYHYQGKEVLIQGPYTGTDAQLWNLSLAGTKVYKAINKGDGLAITAISNALYQVQLQPFANLPSQIWGYNVITATATAGITERKSLVYFSTVDEPNDFPGSMDQLANPANASKWSYVAANADGYCQSFITMNAANAKGNVSTLASVAARFTHKNCYFSADVTSQRFPNNDSTDKAWLQQIIDAGFDVTSTDIFNANPANSISPVNKVNTLQTYPDNLRPCRVGGGPWTFGGDINRSFNDNNNLRNMIGLTDGMALDGPLGLWFTDQTLMKEGTLSATDFVHNAEKKISFILAPSGFGVTGHTTYTPSQYLPVAISCIQYIEDNHRYMDEWDIYPYQSLGYPIFPETTTVNGQTAPAPTQTGVAYYFIKHLNDLPAFNVSTGTVPSNVTVAPGNTSTTVTIGSGTDRSYSLPIKLTNGNDPQVDIAPLIAAAITGATADWKVTFTTSIGPNYDITGAALDGGFWSVGLWRLTNTNSYTLSVNLTALKTNSQPISINLITAANYANTANKFNYAINAKTQ